MNKKTYLNAYGFFVLLFFFILFYFSIISLAKEQDDTWAKIYGSLKFDTAVSLNKTSNGDFSEKTAPKPELDLILSDKGKKLSSNLPIFVKETEVGNINIDSDSDGIAQEWEDKAMEYINPYIELDEEEDWLVRREAPHIIMADLETDIVIPPLMDDLGEKELKKYGGSGVVKSETIRYYRTCRGS